MKATGKSKKELKKKEKRKHMNINVIHGGRLALKLGVGRAKSQLATLGNFENSKIMKRKTLGREGRGN